MGEAPLRALNGNGSGMAGNTTTNPFAHPANGPSSPLARPPLVPQSNSPFGLPGLGFLKPNGSGLAGSEAPTPTKPSNGSGNAQPSPSAFSPPAPAPESNALANDSRAKKLKRLNELNDELTKLREQEAKVKTKITDAEK